MLPFLSYLTLRDIMTVMSVLEVTQGHSFARLSEILVENRDFFIPPCIRRSRSEYSHPVWYGKTRMVVLPDGEKTLSI